MGSTEQRLGAAGQLVECSRVMGAVQDSRQEEGTMAAAVATTEGEPGKPPRERSEGILEHVCS